MVTIKPLCFYLKKNFFFQKAEIKILMAEAQTGSGKSQFQFSGETAESLKLT